MDQRRHKPVKRGDVVPSIPDHNLDLPPHAGWPQPPSTPTTDDDALDLADGMAMSDATNDPTDHPPTDDHAADGTPDDRGPLSGHTGASIAGPFGTGALGPLPNRSPDHGAHASTSPANERDESAPSAHEAKRRRVDDHAKANQLAGRPAASDHSRAASAIGPPSGDSDAGATRDDNDGTPKMERRDRRFPSGLLLAPGFLALLVAASAAPIAGRNALGVVGAAVIALVAGGVAATCFGVIAARSEPEVGRILGPAGLMLATLAAGVSIVQLL